MFIYLSPPPLSILGCSVEKWLQQFPPGNKVFLVSDFLHWGTPNNYNCISCYPTNALYFPQCGFHKTSGGEKQRKEERRPLGKVYSPPGQLKSNLYDVSWNDVEWLNVSIHEFTSAAKQKIAAIYSSSCGIPEVKSSTTSSAHVRRCVAALVHGLRC